jgi:hypothetical protein
MPKWKYQDVNFEFPLDFSLSYLRLQRVKARSATSLMKAQIFDIATFLASRIFLNQYRLAANGV